MKTYRVISGQFSDIVTGRRTFIQRYEPPEPGERITLHEVNNQFEATGRTTIVIVSLVEPIKDSAANIIGIRLENESTEIIRRLQETEDAYQQALSALREVA